MTGTTTVDRRLRLAENDIDRLNGDVKRVQDLAAEHGSTLDGLSAAVVTLSETVEQLAAKARQKPEPVYSWLRATDPDAAVAQLEALERWLLQVYLQYPETQLVECWRRHAWVVEELFALRDGYLASWADGASPTLRLDWHRRHRPQVTEAINAGIGDCRLEKHVITNPADFKPVRLVGLDDGAAVARWWTGTHGQTVDPTPSRDTLAESEARRSADLQSQYAQH